MPRPKNLYAKPKRKKTIKRPEQVAQIHLFRFLKQLMVAQQYKKFMCFHPSNGGYRTPAEGSIFKQMGVTAGVSDFIIMIAPNKVHATPHMVFVELKVGKNGLSDNQKWFLELTNSYGFSGYELCVESHKQGADAMCDILNKHGVII